MRQDAWRAYLEMALGMTEASRKKATKAVRQMLGKGGATAEQLQGLAEELFRASTANREAISKLVRVELDRALGRVGLATAEEVADLTARVHQLENELDGVPGGSGTDATADRTAPVPAAPARKVAKKAVRKAVAPQPAPKPAALSVAKRTGAMTPTVPAAPAKAVAARTSVTKAVAATPVAAKPVAATAVPKKAVATKALAGKAAGSVSAGRRSRP